MAEATEIDRGGAAVADDIGAATLAVVVEVRSTEVTELTDTDSAKLMELKWWHLMWR